jgi:hypothetical protein
VTGVKRPHEHATESVLALSSQGLFSDRAALQDILANASFRGGVRSLISTVRLFRKRQVSGVQAGM